MKASGLKIFVGAAEELEKNHFPEPGTGKQSIDKKECQEFINSSTLPTQVYF